MEHKSLVAYFSASGITKKVANTFARATGSDCFEIVPKEKYTSGDLDWRNPHSRSSVEMQDKTSRPEIATLAEHMEQYDTIYLGFPIWWYVAPTIIHTFLEQYDFAGKTIIPFATSGSSTFGNTTEELKCVCPVANWKQGKVFPSTVSEEAIAAWLATLE